jgi:SAM-dependent methyltransferase
MALEKQLSQVEQLYSTNLKEKGVNSTAVGWNSRECQQLRFDKLISLVAEEESPFSLNDYGCGFGSLLLYLAKKERRVSAYNGYDISNEMLDEAGRQLTGQQETRVNLFNASQINTQADFGFVSGTFNVRFDASKEAWHQFIEKKLQELDANCSKGFSFNLLTSYVDWEEPHLFYGDPCYWFDFCKRSFSKKVTLLHDYDLWEWTIVVDKK